MGQDFLPYMSVVMPPLLLSAQLKPDVTITSADSDNEIEDSDDERYFLLEIHLILIVTACMHVHLMCVYLSFLSSVFFPFL